MSELRKLIYNSLVYIVEPSIKGKDLDKIVEGIVKGIREFVQEERVIDSYEDDQDRSYTNGYNQFRADMLKRLEG